MKRKEFTKEQIAKLIENSMSNARASLALEGIYISDTNFEKIKAIAADLEKVI